MTDSSIRDLVKTLNESANEAKQMARDEGHDIAEDAVVVPTLDGSGTFVQRTDGLWVRIHQDGSRP